MADGRCFTINTSSQLLNNRIMETNKVALVDNYAYRQLLQKKGPELINQIQSTQDANARCSSCDRAL